MTYHPTPGTLVYRAHQHLLTLPPGTVLTSAVLADALGLDESKTIYPSLLPAVTAGLLHMDRHPSNNRLILWSLGDGRPAKLDADPDDEPEEPLHRAPVEIPKTALVWPGLATPPEDTRPAIVASSERAWTSGAQRPHRGATPDVGNRRGRPPTIEQGAPTVATTVKKPIGPMEFTDIAALQITDDPITPATKIGGDKYSHLFSKMKLGQSIKCRPDDAPKVAGAMRKWVKEQGTGAIVRAVSKYPADGLGRVWMLKPDRAGS